MSPVLETCNILGHLLILPEMMVVYFIDLYAVIL